MLRELGLVSWILMLTYIHRYQIELLRAALFGRYFDEYANAGAYVQMCQTMRVLNAIRHAQIGLPLTYVQYEALGAAVVVSRLIARRHFALAIEVSKYLRMSDEDGIVKVLSNWALFKVGVASLERDSLCFFLRTHIYGKCFSLYHSFFLNRSAKVI